MPFQPGRSGNPAGGPVGSRHRQQLNGEFIAALLRDFRHGGPAAIAKVRKNQPAVYCRYCCKSPKLPGANFPAVKKSDQRPPIDVASITLPGSPASFSSDDEVPHIFTWKSPVQPKEILIASAKRLLQQNLQAADIVVPSGSES